MTAEAKTHRASIEGERRLGGVRQGGMWRRVLAGVLGLGLTLTALVMLFAPAFWYVALPGVASSGPLNAHFARDLGCANLVAGAVLLALAVARRTPTSALLAAAAFLLLHAGVHGWELLSAVHGAGHRILRDLPTVYVPAALTAWLAIDARAHWPDSRRAAARPRVACEPRPADDRPTRIRT
jgi:hypothetical protein